jgi:hypothetical protein
MSLAIVLDFIFVAGGIAGLVATPFLIAHLIRYWLALKRAPFPNSRAMVRFPTKTVLFFITPIILAVVAANVATARSRRKVVEFLRQPGAAQFTVLVNGRRAANGSEILLALQRISRHGAHHSHPTNRMRLEIDGASSRLSLEFGRDSARPQEYWVFEPAGIITNGNEIGRITTHLFDDY